MTHEEYIDLFHKAQVNLVAFKPVFHCNEELRHMVEMAVEAEREAFAAHAVDIARRAVKAEREACIVDIQMHIPRSGKDTAEYKMAMRMIERIRARGEA